MEVMGKVFLRQVRWRFAHLHVQRASLVKQWSPKEAVVANSVSRLRGKKGARPYCAQNGDKVLLSVPPLVSQVLPILANFAYRFSTLALRLRTIAWYFAVVSAADTLAAVLYIPEQLVLLPSFTATTVIAVSTLLLSSSSTSRFITPSTSRSFFLAADRCAKLSRSLAVIPLPQPPDLYNSGTKH